MLPTVNEPIDVAVILTHYCNLRCEFCYLHDWELGNRLRIQPERLRELLDELSIYRKIDTFEMYGGELQLLPREYLTECLNILRSYKPLGIDIITNLTLVTDFIFEEDVSLSVSFDGTAREHWDKTLRNMQSLNKEFRVLTVASRAVLEQSVDDLIDMYNSCPKLISVEIKPYSINSDNQQDVKDSEYERFVWEFIRKSHRLNATLENIGILESSLNKTKISFNQDYIGVQPSGKFGILDFDDDDQEFVCDIEDYSAYLSWVVTEVERTLGNEVCVTCEFLGSCTSEHLRKEHRHEDSCSGHRNLIRWSRDYKDNLFEESPWKRYMRSYNRLQTRFKDFHPTTEHIGLVNENDLENAVRRYIVDAPNELMYPIKSYINAIVYAQTLNELYEVHPTMVLSDPDLFLGQDPFYRTIIEDRLTYERIFRVLDTIPNWQSYPWPQATRHYCIEECTAKGIQDVTEQVYHA